MWASPHWMCVLSLQWSLRGEQRPTDLLVPTSYITRSPADQKRSIVCRAPRQAVELTQKTSEGYINQPSGFSLKSPQCVPRPLVLQTRDILWLGTVCVRMCVCVCFSLLPSLPSLLPSIFFKTYHLPPISEEKSRKNLCPHLQSIKGGLVYPWRTALNYHSNESSLTHWKGKIQKRESELPGGAITLPL